MRRLPIFSGLFVAAAVAVMIGLGVWQLQRAAWKEAVLADLAAAQTLPVIELDPLLASGQQLPALAFRRVRVSCRSGSVVPAMRVARSREGGTGYGFFVPCRPEESGAGGRIQVNAGWAPAPDPMLRVEVSGLIDGVIGEAARDGPIVLTAATPYGSLAASAPPTTDDIPNNHLAYAGQWFFFAAAAAVIFLLAVRRRGRSVSA